MEKIIEKINNANSIALFTHCNADLDAYGSVGAIYHWLKSEGKQVCIFLCEQIPEKFSLLGLDDTKYEPEGKFDLAISLDCSSISRIEKYGDFFKSMDNIMFDHHQKSESFAKIELIDVKSPSTCEIVFNFFEQNKIQITPIIATCIYTGIMGDTGCLMHDNTNEETYNIVNKLVRNGCDKKEVKERILISKTLQEVKVYEKIISSLEIQNGVASSVLTIKDKKTLNILDNIETGDVINLILSIDNVNISVLLKQSTKNIWRVSLRSKSGFDVSAVATKYGGGGHKQAAGFTVVGNLQYLKNKIVKDLCEIKEEDWKN